MASIMRSVLPFSSKNHDNRDDEENNSVEYSFAMEYSGPFVSYEIPKAVPVDISRIPTASIVATASMWDNLSLPVIHPIVRKSDQVNDKLSKVSKLGSELAASSAPATNLVHRDSESGLVGSRADGIESSGTLGFSDSRQDSNELSGSSDVEELEEYDGVMDSHALSSEISPCDEEESIDHDDEGASCNGNKGPIVTFRDPEARDVTCTEETDYNETKIVQQRPPVRTDVKKGLCHRCFKGNRLTEKEFCIVCGARYCSNCVVRAMGSMPEGRKCITCIGYPIDESKRKTLGKSSRMLKRLFTAWEIKQIMSFEISCEANQLLPESVYVNGRALTQEEMVDLRSCKHPPKKLRPGRYWYDKVSGLWGKEGQKPCQIISPQLTVGDAIMQEASNGNTNVLVNCREITKSELFMLEMAGIRCEGRPHFWIGADGSFQEEGQKNVLGNIWGKHGIKLLCAVLSLPTPPETANLKGEEVDNVPHHAVQSDLEQKTVNKFLLVGCDQSGTSTIFKQAKIIYKVPFSEDERQNIKLMIQSNLYRYISILLEGRECFEEEFLTDKKKKCILEPGPSGISEHADEKSIYSISPKLKHFSDWLLQVMVSGNLEAIFPAATREYSPLVEELWRDRAFQAAYKRRNELHTLPKIANYFLDRAVEVSRADYEPSDMDILYAEGINSSNGIACVDFSFPNTSHDSFRESDEQNDALLRCQLIRVPASSLGENCKWLEMFEDVDMVLYCVSLTDYDQFLEDNDGVRTNKMLASKKLFESIVTRPSFTEKDFLLILNKFDLLEEKIEETPLSQCEWFNDFDPVKSHHSPNRNCNKATMAQRSFHYIAIKFKRLFHSLTERKLYVVPVIGLEPDSVSEALIYASEVLKWEDARATYSMNDWSYDSIEVSTTS